MRLHGWCTVCRRVRRVRVTAAGLIGAALGGVVQGECDECERRS